MDPIIPTSFESQKVKELLFHPRAGLPVMDDDDKNFDLFFSAGDGQRLTMRFFMETKEWPTLLFFHGNGEVASDYDEIAPHFKGCGFNFVVGEYRGYGLSHGEPGLSHLMDDARTTFLFLEAWLKNNGWTGPLAVMGRSLGSAPALEISDAFGPKVSALVIESGFARLRKLLHTLGLPEDFPLPKEAHGTDNLTKASRWEGPFLVIHAHNDEIIPLNEGEDLFSASPAPKKQFLKIENVGHNDILLVGFHDYFKALSQLAQTL